MLRSTTISRNLAYLLIPVNAYLVYALATYALTRFPADAKKDIHLHQDAPVAAILNEGDHYDILNLSAKELRLEDNLGVVPLYPEKLKIGKNQKAFLPSDSIVVSPELIPFDNSPFCEFCKKTEMTWTIPRGNHEVQKNIVIPTKIKLIIEAGATLNMKEGTSLFAQGPVLGQGTATQPIRFQGDKWGSVVFLQTDKTTLHHTHFDGGSWADLFGMRYTGMVNFIGGEVELNHVSFTNTHGEDGVNLKYAKGTMSNITIRKTFQDGLDADWSELNMQDFLVEETGNDCLDFSDGKIQVERAILRKCSDKAISNGEANQLSINDIQIFQSPLGIVNKDYAKLNEKNVSFESVKTPVSSYIKKPFFRNRHGTL